MSDTGMKSECKQHIYGKSTRCMGSKEKKCRSSRKKVNPFNFDRDRNNGLQQKEAKHDAEPQNSNLPLMINSTSSKKKRGKKTNHRKMLTKKEKMYEQLQQCLSEDVKKKISETLDDIRMLSDVEKLFLYLQLPTGSSFEDDPLKQKGQSNPLGKKADEEGTLAVNWIQSHLEEDPEVSLPKQEVYDEYQSYCEITGNEALCAADFGKVMKQIFPSVKPRRLGTRGNSRYCYSGLRKKFKIELPSLPDLDIEKENRVAVNETDEIVMASCYVLFEWAEKLLGTKFTSLRMLASYLIENMLVDNRSVAAYTLLLAASTELVDKGSVGNTKLECKNKKSDAQVHLHRKIQEKELIKEQKQKLEEQRSCLLTRNSGKCVQSRKKGMKSKKAKTHSLCNGQLSKSKESIKNGVDVKSNADSSTCENACESRSEKTSLKSIYGNSYICAETCQTDKFSSAGENNCFFSSSSDQQKILVTREGKKKKRKSKILPNENTPVCISQSLPGFIIVPSLPQVHLTDTAKKTSSKCVQKYKRIQPKPTCDLPKPTVMRCRAGSLGSVMLKEGRSHADGRRSSLALMTSDNTFECETDFGSSSVGDLSESCSNSSKSSGDSVHKENVKDTENILLLQKQNPIVKSSPVSDLDHEQQCPESTVAPKSEIIIGLPEVSESERKSSDSQLDCGNDNIDDTSGTKRHCEEPASQVVSKKRHLDEVIDYEVSSPENLSTWSKDMIAIKLEPTFGQRTTDEDHNLVNNCEEVSIHELESDALIDYLQGSEIGNESSEIKQSPCKNSVPLNVLDENQEKVNEVTNPEVCQLSQLRILLEKNLPCSFSKVARNSNDQNTATKKSVLMHTNDFAPESFLHNRRKLVFGNEVCDIFIRNTNPYLSSESAICSTASLPENQINSSCITNEAPNEGTITEQDILAVMSNSMSYVKEEPHLDSTSSTRMLQNSAEDVTSQSPTMSSNMQQLYSTANVEHSSIQTQVPSVPPSPNTRRRAFNFMPISPRHTPIPDGVVTSATACHSPVPTQHSRNTVSIGVGPSQPPSNAGSPFVSPRSTPVPPSRSRHSSGQSTYSASRHTPFQNFDSGVSSISSSPFISPQPTPVPLSRLRHNSSHGPSKTVTFSTVNNNQIIHTLSSNGHSSLRLRHSSGSSGGHTGFALLSPRSAPLSPLVNENGVANFTFNASSETRSRHSSGIAVAPLSPVSEQASISNVIQPNEPSVVFDGSSVVNDPFIGDSASKNLSVTFGSRNTRQRHASSSVIYSKPSMIDSLAQEVQLLLKNGSDCSLGSSDLSSRSRSVPLHQMLPNVTSSLTPSQVSEEKFSPLIIPKQNPALSMLVSNSYTSSLSITNDSLMLNCEKSLQPMTSDWSSLDGTSEIEMSTARRNLNGLLEAPLGDDLQTTLEDLRDCDTDFSKFAQELEQLSKNEEGDL